MNHLLYTTILLLVLLLVSCAHTSPSDASTQPPQLPVSDRGPRARYYITLKPSFWWPGAKQRRHELLTLLKDSGVNVSGIAGALYSVTPGITAVLDRASVYGLRQLPYVHSILHLPTLQKSIDNARSRRQFPTYRAGDDAFSLHASGITGAGLRIGIIDSGVDYRMPALGGGFGHGYKVVYGRNYVTAEDDGGDYGLPEHSPMERCDSHGTVAALIAAGNSEQYKGLAPEATLGAYRVMPCHGLAKTRNLERAIRRATKDGMHVINISLGFPTIENEVIQQIRTTTALGIIIVTAAGNAGERGLWSMKMPSGLPDVLTVASAEVSSYRAHWFSLVQQYGESIVYHSYCGAIPRKHQSSPSLVMHVAVHSSTGCTLSAHPSKLPITLLLSPGDCDIKTLLRAAKKAGIIAVIVNSDSPDLQHISQNFRCTRVVSRIWPAIYPAMLYVPADERVRLLRYIQEHGDATIAWQRTQREYHPTSEAYVSTYSTLGPGRSIDVKPDLMAPGERIHAIAHPITGSFGPRSGTSYAAPYVAGAVALYLHQRKRRGDQSQVTLAEVRTVLQNAGQPVRHRQNRFPTHVLQQGAGLLVLDRLIYGGTQVSPSALRLGDRKVCKPQTISDKSILKCIITIINRSREKVWYDLGHISMYSLARIPLATKNATNLERVAGTAQENLPAQVSMEPDQFSLKPGQHRSVSVVVSKPEQLPAGRQWLYSGYIVVKPKNEGAVAVHVPYVGLEGSLSDVVSEFAMDKYTWLNGE